MRNERLTVLMTSQEKRRLSSLAKTRKISVGELLRRSAAKETGAERDETLRDEHGDLTPSQRESLGQAADRALAALGKAETALDLAEREIAATRAYFAARAKQSDKTLQSLIEDALATSEGAAA